MAMGISYISIYDVAGICKQNRQLLESELQRQHNFALGKDASSFYVHFHLQEWNRMEGTMLNNSRVDLLLLSLADGRQGLVTAAKQLTHQVINNQLRIEAIIPSHVDAVMQGHMGFPDPDLVLKFGQVNSLLGYLPWQIRLSSILSLSTHRHISYTSFYRALHDYSNVEQRLGK
ncbi:Dehydrodolichyl diphosphate synthase complex subunit Nus1 [Lamellibrachia satsuma]|nr:Dehydrodolichyl diphosphate synthase complex subunit Nus1 [Lamellibrachia satsuma]